MAYILKPGSDRVESLDRVRCRSEETELQRILCQNTQLLPPEQISPEDPPRWLLVGREVAVPDPATGHDRWKLDVFLLDHNATPTLVECKRYLDSRARRSVIAQMIDYAANGHYYWSASGLQQLATATHSESELKDWFEKNSASGADSVEEYFTKAEENLRNGRLRLIFFLEDSSPELRSMVDFLNRQMTTTEVLIVEVRMYDTDAGRIVDPRLFGFTEQARVAKREAVLQQRMEALAKGKASFVESIRRLDANTFHGIERLLGAFGDTEKGQPGWRYGSAAIFSVPSLSNKGCFAIRREDGRLELYWGYWKHPDISSSVEQMDFIDALHAMMQRVLSVEIPKPGGSSRFPSVRASDWVPRVDALIQGLRELVVGTSEPSVDDDEN